MLPLTFARPGYVTLPSHAQTALILDALERRREVPLATLHTHGDGGRHGAGSSAAAAAAAPRARSAGLCTRGGAPPSSAGGAVGRCLSRSRCIG